MKNKSEIKRFFAKWLIVTMCGIPITGCGQKDENTAIVNGVHVDINKESYINIDHFLEDPGEKNCNIGEHHFYAYDYRPSARTSDREGSFVINPPEGYKVYDYETLSSYHTHDIIKITFVNTVPVRVESVKHEDRDTNSGRKYYYWDYCYHGKVIELEAEKPLVKTNTINQ